MLLLSSPKSPVFWSINESTIHNHRVVVPHIVVGLVKVDDDHGDNDGDYVEEGATGGNRRKAHWTSLGMSFPGRKLYMQDLVTVSWRLLWWFFSLSPDDGRVTSHLTQQMTFIVLCCVCVFIIILLITSTQENTGGIQVAHVTHLHPRQHRSPCLGCNNNSRNYIYRNMPLSNGTHYIDILFQGRLGNLMFQYSAMYCTARTNGLVPIMHDGEVLREIFPQLDSMVPGEKSTGTEFVGFSEERSMTFDDRMLSLHLLNASIHLHGFYQSWKYCHLYKHEMQRQFTFSKHTQHKSATFLESIRSMFSNLSTMGLTFVGLHVRWGGLHWTSQKICWIHSGRQCIHCSSCGVLFKPVFPHCLRCVLGWYILGKREYRYQKQACCLLTIPWARTRPVCDVQM